MVLILPIPVIYKLMVKADHFVIMWLFVLIFFCLVILIMHIYTRLSYGINRSAACLVGKTAIVTGANSGLGYQTALNLASRGCRVIMADVADMEESQLNITKQSNNANIVAKELNLSSLRSVRDFVADFLETEQRLDILINNAGVGAYAGSRTADNLHPLMQINYFGHFLLTHLLIDVLKKSAPSRIVFTSSRIAFANNLTLNNLNFDGIGNLFKEYHVYGNSKLAMLIASDIFAEKLKDADVTSNCVHPGLVATAVFSKSYRVTRNIFYLMFSWFCVLCFSKDPWEGAQTLLHVAVSQELEQATGIFFADCKPVPKPPLAYDSEFCHKIWTASEDFVGLRPRERLI